MQQIPSVTMDNTTPKFHDEVSNQKEDLQVVQRSAEEDQTKREATDLEMNFRNGDNVTGTKFKLSKYSLNTQVNKYIDDDFESPFVH
jgi:hypothetical protein